MSWEEKIFQRSWRSLRDLVLPSKQDPEGIVYLQDVQARLLVVARALCGVPIEIAPATAEGGYGGNVFYLPRRLALTEDQQFNKDFYLFRVAYLSAQWHLNLNWPVDGTEARRLISDLPLDLQRAHNTHGHALNEREQTLTGSRKLAIDVAQQVLARMEVEMPGLQSLAIKFHERLTSMQQDSGARARLEAFHQTPVLNLLYGRFMRGLADRGRLQLTADENKKDELVEDDDNDSEQGIETQLDGRAAEELEVLEVDQKRIEEYTLSHNFEKVETLSEFDGNWREMDGSDELEDHQEALDQLDLSRLVRSDDPVHSIYGLDFFRESQVGEVTRKKTKAYHIMYPEWDVARRTYRKDYVTLLPEALSRKDDGYAARVLKEHSRAYERVSHAFEKILNRPRWLYRQLDGSDPDTAALVTRYADVQAGTTPSRHIYMQRRHRESDTAVLFLLDLSLSADGYVDNRRILDRETEAVVLIGEAMAEAGMSFQVDGFASHTRNEVYYKHFKLFEEDWKATRDRLGFAGTGGYTRIGAALRHANFLLEKTSARRRWLLLLSDAKPNDYDRYEGRHGIADVRQALRESARRGIGVYTLALDPAARGHLPLMLGPGQYTLLNHPNELPDVMARLILKFRA